ncbi:MAG: GNAT family N-acetyltransferase [Pseudomonadota bacterium]
MTTIDTTALPPSCIVNQGEDWVLVSPIPDEIAEPVARYAVAQRATLNRIVGKPEVRQELLGNRLRADRICACIVQGQVGGILSYRMDGAGATWPDPKRYRQHFGPLGGTVRYWLTQASLQRGQPDELYIEGFKVDPIARGRGIGKALLGWLGDEVVRRGKVAWRTEASSTADAAVYVYQSVGAKIVKTMSLGPAGYVFDRHKITVLRWQPQSPSEAA